MSAPEVGPGRGYIVPITKAELQADGRLRIEGLASDESIDSDQEIVDFDALADTLAAWPGNLREMHQPKAVGRALQVKADREAREVRVLGFVSKGSPDTIEKVLDGTLAAFSFGFEHDLRKRKRETVNGKTATRVYPTRTAELSLVDSGANKNAKFVVAKLDDLKEADAMPEPNETPTQAEALAPETVETVETVKADETEEDAPADDTQEAVKIDAKALEMLQAAADAISAVIAEYSEMVEDGPDRVEEEELADMTEEEKADQAPADESEKVSSVKADYIRTAEKAQSELRDQVATLSAKLDDVLAQPASGGPVRAATKSLGGAPASTEPTLPASEELSTAIRGLPQNQQEEIRKAAALSAIRASRQR